MATGKVTISSIAKLDGWLWDTTCIGFGARRQTNKGVHYYVRYRHDGSQIVRSIGRHGSPWTPDTARTKARELLGGVAGGGGSFLPLFLEGDIGAGVQNYLLRKKGLIQ